MSGGKGNKSKRGSSSRGDVEEEYVKRVRERLVPVNPKDPDYETYQYVEAAPRDMADNKAERTLSRSITYETNPRHSGRLVERERVVIEDGGRRREYYQALAFGATINDYERRP